MEPGWRAADTFLVFRGGDRTRRAEDLASEAASCVRRQARVDSSVMRMANATAHSFCVFLFVTKTKPERCARVNQCETTANT